MSGEADTVDCAEFEVVSSGDDYATASGPREIAWAEALHYAAQFRDDGHTVQIFEVTKREVPAGPVPPMATTPAAGGTIECYSTRAMGWRECARPDTCTNVKRTIFAAPQPTYCCSVCGLDATARTSVELAQALEKRIHDGLVKLGWTPPGGDGAALAKREAVAVPEVKWGRWPEGVTEVRYLTDDRDLPEDEQHELVIRLGGNHDWYVSVMPKGHGFAPAVRLCTSGGASRRVPGLCPAIADAFAMLADSQQAKGEGK